MRILFFAFSLLSLTITAQGGVPYKLVKGDMLMVPENTAHSVTQVEGTLVLMSLHLPRTAAAPTPVATPAR
jgi:quercetin dioxygenase-like cupin family protein